MTETTKKTKKLPLFYLIYALYVVILAVLGTSVYLYVRNSLVLYEESQPDVYMNALLQEWQTDAESRNAAVALSLPDERGTYHDNMDKRRGNLAQVMGQSSLTMRLDESSYDTSAPIYLVLADEEPILKVKLATKNVETRIAIIPISEWEVADVTFVSQKDQVFTKKDGKYTVSVKVPDACRVYVNDILLTEKEIASVSDVPKELLAAADYVDVPTQVRYEVKDLAFEPKVLICNQKDEPLEVPVQNNMMEIPLTFKVSEMPETIRQTVDPIEVTKTWSKLMTDDLVGEGEEKPIRHGVDQVRQYLAPNSYIDKLAYDFATSIDITFVSKHTLDGFSKESITNFIMYNENCFSCDVYFEKHLTVGTRTKRTDVFNNRCYFVYLEDASVAKPGWYMVDMQTILQ